MSIRVRADWEGSLAVVVLEGLVTAAEFGEQVVPLLARPEFNQMQLTLLDMSRATGTDSPSENVRAYAREAARHVDATVGTGARMALVAGTDEFFGLGRMYEMSRVGSSVEFNVFRDLAEAEQWLGLEKGYESRLDDVVTGS